MLNRLSIDCVLYNLSEMSGLWALLNVLALAVTLWYIIRYTKASQAMAIATEAMAKATAAQAASQAEDSRLRRQPVVLVSCDSERQTEFYFRTFICNNGPTHAKCLVRATVSVDGRVLELPPDSLYNGEWVWELQVGNGINGHLSFEDLFKYNKLVIPPERKGDVRVTLESSVIYYYDPEDQLKTETAKNPPAHYHWSGLFGQDMQGQWIPDPSTKKLEA